jgi:hypothetical protein
MRKVLISLAAAGTALAFATPADAQWAPRPAYGGYEQGMMQRWQGEIQQLRFQMDQLGRSGRLTGREAWDLRNDIRSTERALYRDRRRGFSPGEARSIDRSIARIRHELRRYSDYDGRRGDWRRDRRDRY